MWGSEEKLLVSKHQLYETTNTKPPKPNVPLPKVQVEGAGGAGGGDDLSLASMDSYQFKETSTEERKPQLIVELQVREKERRVGECCGDNRTSVFNNLICHDTLFSKLIVICCLTIAV